MKRGPVMPRGIALAIPLALQRGHVMVFIRSLLNLGEFLITGNGRFVMVSVRLARNLYAGIDKIEAEFAEVITGLRLVPRTGPVSCEHWLYSRYGTLRHFRIGNAGLVEVDLYGTPLDQVKPAVTGSLPLGNETRTPQGATAPGPSAPGTADNSGPILRWLAKWNAARSAGKGGDAAESGELRKILDAGGPAGKTKRVAGKKPVTENPVAAGPADPEKNPGPEKPVAGRNRHPGKKPVAGGIGTAGPEEKPGPVVPGDPPASTTSTVPAVKEQLPEPPDIAHEGGKI